jgi:glucoamylase
MVQAAMGKLACGDAESARRTLFYLKCTQEANGNWPQNMWLDGTPNWTGIQMDGTGFGILLADLLRRANELEDCEPWPMIRKAAEFLVRNGPVTQQERWEENSGYSPNTMAVEVASLLAAADFADVEKETKLAEFLRLTADAWNEAIDALAYAHETDLARRHGVEGYYIRIAPPETIETGLQKDTKIRLKNQSEESAERRAVDVLSPGVLGLVRLGLRAADDPRILNSLKIVDTLLRSEVSNGPVWHRYTDDGYGEHPDGRPFNKTGKGRGWPLLAGERAHYEIARGNFAEAVKLRETMAAQTSECGMIPEQVWDAGDIPERRLFNGRPTGSGMPLAWAHAEYIRLLRSLKERKVWDMPPQTVERYQVARKSASFAIWTFEQQRKRLLAGKNLRVDCAHAAQVRWSVDGWKTTKESKTVNSELGVYYAVLDTAALRAGRAIDFTFYWPESGRWEGRNFEVKVV